jgi:DNA mismatch repair ATPase MutS
MHLEITKKKKILLPLLQSVAFLDAYCSIAQLYKKSQKEDVVFSFPEFIESETPFINYEKAWLPLLEPAQAVSNNIIFGKTKPAKIIITGPNGGGKSTFLKSLGIGVILAQSWGIVPAKQAQQSLFSVIRTGLAPREDLAQGLSTFMAEKKTMAELLEDIHRSNNEQKTLILVDEPYKGTVDAESAKRIYDFGKDIIQYPQALVIIATHVKKPITLAKDTAGIFGNYQVKIRETSLGVFERLFKLEEGPADWWFEDAEKRSRFVDWISVKGNFAR